MFPATPSLIADGDADRPCRWPVGHVRPAAGIASAAFGLILSWQIGFVDGLFRF